MSKQMYLNLALLKGVFFHYSAHEEEGYEAHETTTGKTHFRKYFDKGIIGQLDYVKLDNEARFGREIRLGVFSKEDDVKYHLNVKLEPFGDNIQDYSESLIKVMGSLELGNVYRFYPYVLAASEEFKYDKKGLSVKAVLEVETEGTPPKYEKIPFSVEKDDVPRWIKTKKKGKVVWDRSDTDEFLYNECVKQCERLAPVPMTDGGGAEEEAAETEESTMPY